MITQPVSVPRLRPAVGPCLLLCSLLIGQFGCEQQAGNVSSPVSVSDSPPTPTAPARLDSEAGQTMSVDALRKQLGVGQAGRINKAGSEIVAVDMRDTPLSDLAPLRGLPLRQLYLEGTRVSDLSPLAGMPLEELYLSNTQVSDLAPLAGMSLHELNLVGTPVEDISALKDVEIGTLWIPQTKVSDISSLAGKPLVSLDVEDTPVADLTPLAGNMSLRRLHIAGTAVSDLAPLAGLKLERLVFSPERITHGIDVVRAMTTLRGLDVQLDPSGAGVMSPEQFWAKYDAGEWTPADGSAPPGEPGRSE